MELIDDFDDNGFDNPFRYCDGSLLQLTIVALWVSSRVYKLDQRSVETKTIRWMKSNNWALCVNSRENPHTAHKYLHVERVAVLVCFATNIDFYRSCKPGGVDTGNEALRLYPKRRGLPISKLKDPTGTVEPYQEITEPIQRV